MADGRDIAVFNRMANARPLSAGVFADSERTTLIGTTDGIEIIVELEPTDYAWWSDPQQGGVLPVRTITQAFVAKQAVREVEFCGYVGRDDILVMFNGKRDVVQRYAFEEAYMFV